MSENELFMNNAGGSETRPLSVSELTGQIKTLLEEELEELLEELEALERQNP